MGAVESILYNKVQATRPESERVVTDDHLLKVRELQRLQLEEKSLHRQRMLTVSTTIQDLLVRKEEPQEKFNGAVADCDREDGRHIALMASLEKQLAELFNHCDHRDSRGEDTRSKNGSYERCDICGVSWHVAEYQRTNKASHASPASVA